MQTGPESDEYFQPSRAQTAPSEVLFQIFELLLVDDRKAVRQVCRKWFEVSQDKRFQLKEKFSIEKLYLNYSDNVLEFFVNVDRQYFNFEFNGLSFKISNSNFWQTCGPRINSLFFDECELSLETFSHVVTNCTSLQQFSLRLCNHKFADSINETRDIDLRPLVDSGLVNTSVKSVYLHFRGLKHQWCNWLVHLLQLFPQAKSFEFFGSEFVWDYELINRDRLAAINDVLFNKNLEDLRIVTYTYQYRELDWTMLAQQSQLTMLTEIAIHVNDSTNKDLLTAFLARQANLKILHFLVRTSIGSIMDDSFDIIFDNCHRLDVLELTSTRRLYWGSTWFGLLARSSLTKLKIECDDLVFPDSKLYPQNSNIIRLNLAFKSYFNASTIPLIEAFSFLEELTIFKITDRIIQAVLEHQEHLTVFNARFKARLVSQWRSQADEMYGEILNNSDIPFFDLSKLRVERLSLPADAARHENFLTFPLKYLRLYPPMGEVFYNPIALDTEKSPLLEEVVIETSCFSYPLRGSFMDNILRFIRPLKRLRFLYITSRTRLVYTSDMPYLDDNFVRKMFIHCPMLVCFIYKRIYFRNNLNREFVAVAELDEKLSRATSNFTYKHLDFPPTDYNIKV